MYLVFKSLDEWFASNQLQYKFQDTYGTIYSAAKDFASHMNNMVQEKIAMTAKISISEILLKQALIDAFDDLSRLTNYHPTKNPNPIKEMSYITYWLVRHKSIRLDNEDIISNEKLLDIARMRLLFLNEEFGVKLLMNSAFEGKEENSISCPMIDEGKRQLKYFKRYLLYYLVYRLDSPKSLEAMILGCTIHPAWKVDPIIWSDPDKIEDIFNKGGIDAQD